MNDTFGVDSAAPSGLAGLRRTQSQGSRPGLNYSAPSGLRIRTPRVQTKIWLKINLIQEGRRGGAGVVTPHCLTWRRKRPRV
jgi:hypothetical protein